MSAFVGRIVVFLIEFAMITKPLLENFFMNFVSFLFAITCKVNEHNWVMIFVAEWIMSPEK